MRKDEIILRKLVIKSFHVKSLKQSENFELTNDCLGFSLSKIDKLITKYQSIKEIKVNIIKPDNHDMWTNSIMDIIPISTKVLGKIGEGITHTLTGVYVMLTGVDEDGVQVAEFGSSEGILKNQIVRGRPGTPSESDFIISFDIVLKSGKGIQREAIIECHKACDEFIQGVRDVLKKMDGRSSTEKHQFYDKIRVGKKRVAIIKQIAGQGAMYDNQILPNEPSGISGGRSIIDMGNAPIILSPNEYRDGAIRAMT